MTLEPWSLAAITLAYAIGSIPTGLWFGRALRGVDIREHGSKNIGATNTMRVLGKPLGAAALVGDMAKGLVAVLLVARLGAWPHLPLACGVAAVLGHSFSLFLGFRGGKGVATATGMFLGLAALPTVIAAAVFGATLAATRMVSAGSIAAALALTAAIWAMPHDAPLRGVTTLLAILVIWKHRDNIRRMRRGEENRI